MCNWMKNIKINTTRINNASPIKLNWNHHRYYYFKNIQLYCSPPPPPLLFFFLHVHKYPWGEKDLEYNIIEWKGLIIYVDEF